MCDFVNTKDWKNKCFCHAAEHFSGQKKKRLHVLGNSLFAPLILPFLPVPH